MTIQLKSLKAIISSLLLLPIMVIPKINAEADVSTLPYVSFRLGAGAGEVWGMSFAGSSSNLYGGLRTPNGASLSKINPNGTNWANPAGFETTTVLTGCASGSQNIAIVGSTVADDNGDYWVYSSAGDGFAGICAVNLNNPALSYAIDVNTSNGNGKVDELILSPDGRTLFAIVESNRLYRIPINSITRVAGTARYANFSNRMNYGEYPLFIHGENAYIVDQTGISRIVLAGNAPTMETTSVVISGLDANLAHEQAIVYSANKLYVFTTDQKIITINMSTSSASVRNYSDLPNNWGYLGLRMGADGFIYGYNVDTNTIDKINASSSTTSAVVARTTTFSGRYEDIWLEYSDFSINKAGTAYAFNHYDGTAYLVSIEAPLMSSFSVDNAAAARAAAARQLAVIEAKSAVMSVLSSGKPLTEEQLLKADIAGVTAKNVDLINTEIAKLAVGERSDIKVVEKAAFKYATVDKIADHSTVASADLISVGLISENSKNKTSILLELKKLPSTSVDTFEEIRAVVAAVEKKLADRQARLAAILAKKR